jgi:CRISPR-associated protein Cmr2
MKTFTALTIGPIYDTFSQARRTRAIWAASYFFSFFIRKILEKAKMEKWEIMLPFNNEIYKGKYGAGLYCDRLYFVNKSRTDLEKFVDKVIEFFAKDFEKQGLKIENNTAESFLKRYLNIHIVEISLSDEQLIDIKNEKDDKGKSCNSVLKILNDLLDNQELTKNYVFDFETNYIIDYFTVRWSSNTELKIDSFGNDVDRYFKSIGEIATSDLFLNNKSEYIKMLRNEFKNEDIELIDQLNKSTTFKDSFQDYHKYYAVLYADGDNISDLLKSVANDDVKLQTFSKKLLDFGLKAEETIMKNGGNAIYLGGEDIFAFLPIAFNQDTKKNTIAHLIYNLDKDFDSTLGEYARLQEVIVPTLSYGLMLTYYKFPMREAMHQAHELLEYCKHNIRDKNAIGVRFQKHSGQYMECFIEKNKKESSMLIYELLTQTIQIKDKKDILSGLIQRLKDDVFFTTFILALRKNRIDAFFKNFFNEEIHAEKADFIDCFVELVKALRSDYCISLNDNDIKEEDKRLKKILFTVLRYYQFIQHK